MMNTIVFTKKNKQTKEHKKCSHILHTHTTESINHSWLRKSGGTRYRLYSQFHCSYLDSRGVPGKYRVKNAGNYLPLIFVSWLPVTSYPVMQLPVAHAPTITSGTPTQHPHKCGLSCPHILLALHRYLRVIVIIVRITVNNAYRPPSYCHYGHTNC